LAKPSSITAVSPPEQAGSLDSSGSHWRSAGPYADLRPASRRRSPALSFLDNGDPASAANTDGPALGYRTTWWVVVSKSGRDARALNYAMEQARLLWSQGRPTASLQAGGGPMAGSAWIASESETVLARFDHFDWVAAAQTITSAVGCCPPL